MAAEYTLTQLVLDKLRITYDDEATTRRITQAIMPQAAAEISSLLGLPGDFDFMANPSEAALFASWCLYAFNDAEDEFIANYQSDIQRLREKWAVVAYAEEE